MAVVEFGDQLFHGEDFLVVLRAPAQQGDKVNDGLGYKALFPQVFEGRMGQWT